MGAWRQPCLHGRFYPGFPGYYRSFRGEFIETQLIPLFELARYYRMPFVERTDLLFVLLWFPLVESVFLTYSFAVHDGLRRVFAIKNRRLFFPFFIAAIILLSRIPTDLVQTLAAANLVTIGGIIVVGFLIFCYLFSFAKQKNRQVSGEE